MESTIALSIEAKIINNKGMDNYCLCIECSDEISHDVGCAFERKLTKELPKKVRSIVASPSFSWPSTGAKIWVPFIINTKGKTVEKSNDGILDEIKKAAKEIARKTKIAVKITPKLSFKQSP